MLIFEPSPLLFIHIPRTGGNSVKLWFANNGLQDAFRFRLQHSIAVTWKEMLGDWFFQVFKFSLVRNPWARFVSFYEFMRQMDTTPSGRRFKSMDFDQYLRSTIVGYSWYLLDCNGDQLVDWVGRFEDLPNCLQPIAERYNMDLGNFPWANKGPDRVHYSAYYTPETKDLVYHKCKWEIDKFGYEFEVV